MPKPKTTTKEISIIDEVTPVIESMKVIEIVDEKSLTSATEILSQAKKYLKELTDDKETMTKPLNESLKIIRAKYKPVETKLETIIESIRKSMSVYQTEQIRLQKIEEDKIAERVAKGTLKLETGIKKIENLDKPVDKVNSKSGKLSFKPEPRFEVIDITLIPHKYLLANETQIRIAMNTGIELPGVRYYTEQVPINKLRQ